MRERDLSGKVFGKWRVIEFAGLKRGRSHFRCICECGTEKIVVSSTLKNGTSTSCGCNIGLSARKRLTKHGMADTKPHMIWCTMRQRCENEKAKAFEWYGARGIKVCERWQSFENFWEDMGPTWSPGLSIDRIDVNGNYEPGNCRWVPKESQSANRRPSSEWSFKNETSTPRGSLSG
jgi:hypothetical protein